MTAVGRAARWLLDPGRRLSSRVVHAAFWAFALSIVLRLVGFGRTVVLGNLLDPSAFGVAAIAVLVVEMLESMSQIGVRQALVQEKRDISIYLNTAWTLQVIRGGLVAVTLAVGAPLVGSFFDVPEAVPMVRVLAAALFLSEFKNIGVVYFERELEFDKEFRYRMAPLLGNLVFAVGLAIMYPSPWAIVGGLVARRLIDAAASYVVHPYRPRFRLESAEIRDLLRFGRWIFISSFLVYLYLSLDDLVVGRVSGVEALGLYTMAFSISQLLTTALTRVTSRVAFPTYAILREDKTRLRRAYERTLGFVALLTVPAAAGLWFVGEAAVELLIGKAWLPMIGAFNVLLLWGLLRSLLSTAGPLFAGIGRPSVNSGIQAAQVAVLAALIYPMTARWGIIGAAWATVVAAIGPTIYALMSAIRTAGGAPRDLIHVVGFPVAHTVLMVAGLAVFNSLWEAEPTVRWLVLAVLIGVVVYAAAVAASMRLLSYLPNGLLPRRAASGSDRPPP